MDRRLEDSAVVLQHLEMQLLNIACDDPGAVIGGQLALPLLQERLDTLALAFAAQRAKLAEDEVLRMEVGLASWEECWAVLRRGRPKGGWMGRGGADDEHIYMARPHPGGPNLTKNFDTDAPPAAWQFSLCRCMSCFAVSSAALPRDEPL
jgi:hypothetical protein